MIRGTARESRQSTRSCGRPYRTIASRKSVKIALCSILLISATARAADLPRAVDAAEARETLERGVAFLLANQNSDGSWGGPRDAIWTFSGTVWSNPATHKAWKVATSGLCVMALLEADRSDAALQAADKAVDYLLEHAVVGRPSEWDTMDSWAYIYGVQALARAFVDSRYAEDPRREQCREAAYALLEKLARCQAVNGGWGYLEFSTPRTPRHQWATSFMTAAAVIALDDARRAGFEVSEVMFDHAVRAVARCRLPSGAYLYSVPVIPIPGRQDNIHNIKGSLCRIPACNLALLAGEREVPEQRIRAGFVHLFRHHRFLDIARNKPIPHETFYQNSGYFYLFGHYYAARLLHAASATDRAEFWPRLRYEIVKLQQDDGAMYDYDMHAYHKPYGTAFGVMTLAESLKE